MVTLWIDFLVTRVTIQFSLEEKLILTYPMDQMVRPLTKYPLQMDRRANSSQVALGMTSLSAVTMVKLCSEELVTMYCLALMAMISSMEGMVTIPSL